MRGLLAAALALLVGLGMVPGLAGAQATPGGAAQLTAAVWQLTAIEGGAPVTVPDPSRYTLQFGPDGWVSASFDCNHGGGSYTVDGETLAIGPMMSTLMACPDEDSQLTAAFGLALDKAQRWSYDGSALRISTSDGQTLVFRAALPGVVWQWQQLVGDDGGIVVPSDPGRYSVQFNPDGTLSALVNCNSGRGDWSVSGDALTIGPIATTRMACPDPALDAQFTAILEQTTTFGFTDGLLQLALKSGGLATFAPAMPEAPGATPAP